MIEVSNWIQFLLWISFMGMCAVNSWAIRHLFTQVGKVWNLMLERAKTDEQMAKALHELHQRVRELEGKK